MPKKNEKQRLHNFVFFFGGGGGGEGWGIRSIMGNVKVAYSCFIIHLIY